MHRRSLLRAIVAFPAVAGAALLPNIARAESRLIPLAEIYASIKSQFEDWDVEGLHKMYSMYIPLLFPEEELHAYVEMSIDWMNARLECEEINARLPGDPEQIVGDAIFTSLDGEARALWRDCMVWMAVMHAMFALSLNYVRGAGHGGMVLGVDPDPDFMRLKIKAEEQHEAGWEVFLAQAQRQYG